MKEIIYNERNRKILLEISNFCENNCAEREQCVEDDCVLYRIEQIIIEKENNK